MQRLTLAKTHQCNSVIYCPFYSFILPSFSHFRPPRAFFFSWPLASARASCPETSATMTMTTTTMITKNSRLGHDVTSSVGNRLGIHSGTARESSRNRECFGCQRQRVLQPHFVGIHTLRTPAPFMEYFPLKTVKFFCVFPL